MITVLSRWLIKNNKEYANPVVRRAYGLLAGIVGIVLNLLLFAGKYLAGVVSGSVSIMADAFNNLSDAGSSFISLLGFHFAGKEPDLEHPFGHGRVEYVSGLGVSMLIILMGVELFRSSIDKVLHPQDLKVDVVTVVVLLGSILVKLYMAIYNRSYGKKIDSSAMKATAMDSLSDCVSTTVVLFATVIYQIFHINIDGFCGIAVAVFILLTGFSSAKETLSPLLGEAPDAAFVADIEELVMRYEEVVGIHDMVIHNYGPGRIMISLHAEVPGNEDIYMLHDVIDRIEMELEQTYQCDAVIHMDPIAVDDAVVMNLRKEVEQLVKELDDVLSIHDFRMVEGHTHTNLIFDVVVPQGYHMADKKLAEEITERIRQKWENYYAVIKVEKAYV